MRTTLLHLHYKGISVPICAVRDKHKIVGAETIPPLNDLELRGKFRYNKDNICNHLSKITYPDG